MAPGADAALEPALRGFDEVFGFLGRGAHDYFKLDDPSDPIFRGTKPVAETGYLTDRLAEEAVAFIERSKAQPFFVYLAFNAVHAPLQAPAEEIARFKTGDPQRDARLAMGKRMDDAIGALMAKLKREGIWEKTLLFFLSDNGGPLAQRADNAPLRGGKHQTYEGGIRVPFLVCWPGRLPPGESEVIVSALDVLPTALAAAGLPAPTQKPLDGIDLVPVLRGEKPAPARDLFWTNGGEGSWAIRSGEWKLTAHRGMPALYNLNQDVGEATDLSAQMPEKVAALTKQMDDWLAQMAPPINGDPKRAGHDGTTPEPKKKKRRRSAGAPPAEAQ